MRRGWAIGLAIVMTLLLVGIGAGAYHAGVNEGISRATASRQVVQVVDGYGWHGGFFPFGLFLFPLFFIALFSVIGGAFRRGPWGGPGHHGHGGPWASEEGRARFEERANEWHTRQHEQGSTSRDPGGGTTTA